MIARSLPYASEHRERNGGLLDKGRPPKDFPALLRWAKEEWAAEVPDQLHLLEIEPDAALGSPELAPEARLYFERTDHATDADKSDPNDPEAAYAKPMHAALWRIHKAYSMTPNATSSDYWWHARFLLTLALNNFDYMGTAHNFGLPPFAARLYTEAALRLWWERYERAPLVT